MNLDSVRVQKQKFRALQANEPELSFTFIDDKSCSACYFYLANGGVRKLEALGVRSH